MTELLSENGGNKMSFSFEVKENLSKITQFNAENLRAELVGYFLSGNMLKKQDVVEFVTENEFNIEHFYKILFHLGLDYEPDMRGKSYVAQMRTKEAEEVWQDYEKITGDLRKNVAKGAFLGAGSVNNPEKSYHLEILFQEEKYCDFLQELCQAYDVNFKKIRVNDKFQLYLKEGEEISKFLALIGANKAVLAFEDIRVMKEMKNNVNRRVNCETANLNKTIDAALKQIDDIQLLQKRQKFQNLPKDLQEVAKMRLENPDLSLQDLGKLMEPQIGKSMVNRKLKKIHEWAEELR